MQVRDEPRPPTAAAGAGRRRATAATTARRTRRRRHRRRLNRAARLAPATGTVRSLRLSYHRSTGAAPAASEFHRCFR